MSIKFKTYEYDEYEAFCNSHCFDNTTKNYTICDEETYVDCNMFPKTILDFEFLIPVTVVWGAMLLIGVLGNLSVCFVILKHPAMRSATNIYLFSLAVSDLLILIFGMVPVLWLYWQLYPYIFGGFICKLHNFMSATGIWASVLTVVAFSIERYSAICHPLRSRWLGDKRVATALFAIWATSILISLPIWHAFQVEMVFYPGTHKESLLSRSCVIPEDIQTSFYDQLIIFYTIGLFFVPLIILTVVYFKIGLTLRKNREVSRNCGIQNNCAENKSVFKILVVVVLNFFVCGAPYHYIRCRLVGVTDLSIDEMGSTRVMVVIAGIFYFSATINPILYNAMSGRYRKAFMDTLWKRASPVSPDGILMNVTKDNGPTL